MKVTYSWIIYSCLIIGSGILCDGKLYLQQPEISIPVNTEDKYNCSNGLSIKWSWICDGRKDCPDGSDEPTELCDRYEYGTNCGRLYVNNDATINKGKKSHVGMLPWNVGIYELNKINFDYFLICAGSIIAPNVIISSANCYWQESMLSNQISINDGQYKVAVGKDDKNFTVIDNGFTQIIEVEMIYLNGGYKGFDALYVDDISITVLANKVSFSNGVTPVCIDWKSLYNVDNGVNTKDVILDMKNGTTPISSERFFKYFDSYNCRKLNEYTNFIAYLDDKKFCAITKWGQVNFPEDSGKGISFMHFNSYYLTGIVSDVAFSAEHDYYAVFSVDIKYYVEWIRGILNKHSIVSSCILPNVEGVVYSYEGSNEFLPHGTLVKQNLTVIENCEVGYHKAYTNGSRFCLGKGKWLSNFEILCFKMCPPLESDSLDIKCSHNGKYSNCSNLSIPNTIATPSCKPSYYTSPYYEQDEKPLQLFCQSNGMWNKQLYRCNPYCGKVYTVNQVLIDNVKKAPVGTAPWNVGIFQLNKKNSNYDLICGGSIIAPNLVVSAAHCFWKNVTTLYGKISINVVYKIAVGKYARDISIIDNDFTQTINVEIIHLNEGYYGPTGFQSEDIAIIVLKERVSFSNGVSPVCIDWSGKYNVLNGELGKIVGWGIVEKGISSPILLETSLPYIDHSSCHNMYANGFESFVTVDKFCAGSALGQGLGKTDSGAGLSFLHFDSYFLTGIVSIRDPNPNSSIAIFTDIQYHIQWISGLYNKYN